MPTTKIALKHCDVIDPLDIGSYLERDGFKALDLALGEMSPGDVVEEVAQSGLRGRGGAGFPCGVKWKTARGRGGERPVLICNVDEGEVGTFKDRYMLEKDPFSLVEGLAIAAYALGAHKAYVYVRAEYHRFLKTLSNAIRSAKEAGFLDHVEIGLREGAGAYICGEESALINSMEGRRGEPRFKPPFPVERGLWQAPTVVNNLETLMNVPHILLRGSRWFREMGTDKSKGTKVFSVCGDVKAPGVYEVVMGTSIRELVVDLALAGEIKMVQVGGASGRIIPRSQLETPLTYETVLGGGGIIAFSAERDPIDMMRRTMTFFADESCGKCTPCRVGTEAVVEVLERLASGDGVPGDMETLRTLADAMTLSSLCGLGQTAAVPLLDSLLYFRKEYENRISQSVFLRDLRSVRRG